MTTEYTKPLPRPAHEELSKPFWDAVKNHEIVMQRCKTCSHRFFYPREACPSCLSPDLEWAPVSGKGRLYSYTVIYQPANRAFQDNVPYIYAMVELEEGPRMIGNLIDCPIEEARVDMPVTAVFDDVTPEVTLVKFKPA